MNDLLQQMGWELDKQTGVIKDKKTGVAVTVNVGGGNGGGNGDGGFNDPYFGRDRSAGPASNNADNAPAGGGAFAAPRGHRQRWANTHRRQANELRAAGIDPATGLPFQPKKDEVVAAIEKLRTELKNLTAN